MLKSVKRDDDNTGIDVSAMKVDKPLIAATDKTSQLLRVSASADWSTNVIRLQFFSVNDTGKKTASHATCTVKISTTQIWLKDWARTAYLIKSRISSLERGIHEGDSHKMKRRMVYRLFGSIVDYQPQYQGMDHVILDSDGHEATASVTFKVGDEGYEMNPCWVDSLGHIAGFIMNGNDNCPKDSVFINHGWERMRCQATFSKGKTYRTYNKMQLVEGALYAGDTYILDGEEIVGVFEGVKVRILTVQSA